MTNKRIIILLAFVAILSVVYSRGSFSHLLWPISGEQKQHRDPYADYSPAEFSAAIKSGSGWLLDVRTMDEVIAGHIAGAKHFDWFESELFESEAARWDKNKPVYVYCASGGRSSDALDLLRKKGFKEVHQLDGGIIAWKSAGFPVEKGPLK